MLTQEPVRTCIGEIRGCSSSEAASGCVVTDLCALVIDLGGRQQKPVELHDGDAGDGKDRNG